MSINFNEHVLGVGPNGELPPHVFDQLEIPDANERAAMQAILDQYQAGQDATDTAVASVVAAGGQTLAALAARFAKVDLAPSGVQATDIANLLDAASAATDEGRDVIRLAPGAYDFAGVTPADIGGCYIVGDGATVTPASYVYPFSSADLVGVSAERNRGTGGRGRIAFEVDDALLLHWTRLFPLTKRLGITMGTAWHTGNGAKWITEAHRHGWEVIDHLPENTTATTYLANGQLDAIAEQSLSVIEAAIGTRQGIGFVYPQHVRSDETDRVLSKYYTRGRGYGVTQLYPRGSANPWLTSARGIDPDLTGGVVSPALRDTIKQLAATDGQMVVYLHYDGGTANTHDQGLTELVRLLRAEGVEIVNPGQIWGDRNVIADPYMERMDRWTLTGAAAWDVARRYHGARSVKLTTGASPSVSAVRAEMTEIPSRPGHFTVMRASVRRAHDSPIEVTSNGQGILWTVAPWHRRINGAPVGAAAFFAASPVQPATGTTLPAANWTRMQELIYLGPSVTRAVLAVQAQNIAGGSVPMWLDEVKVEHVDFVTSVQYVVTLIGTGNVILRTGVPELSRHMVQVSPVSAPAGFISADPLGSNWPNSLIIKSTSAADTMQVRVSITPGPSYDSTTLSSVGA